MSISSRTLVEFILLGPTNDRRQLQDSPVLGDVWAAYAANPGAGMDLLITPHRRQPAGPVAVLVSKRINALALPREPAQDAHVAYLHGFVAARLFFREVLRVMVPLTQWWQERKVQSEIQAYTRKKLRPRIDAIVRWARAGDADAQAECAAAFGNFSALDRDVTLVGIILWAGRQNKKKSNNSKGIGGLPEECTGSEVITDERHALFQQILHDKFPPDPQVWQISRDRKAVPALAKSVPAVKGDAARTLFNVRCNEIRWTVVDSGIDGRHAAFRDAQGCSRIVKAYDFCNIREIVSLDNLNANTPAFEARVAELRAGRSLRKSEAARILTTLAQDADNDRPIDWEQVEKFITIDPATPPGGGHGARGAAPGAAAGADTVELADGMCPDIALYDFRVLSKSLEDTEFAIIAALQFIRYLNERHSHISVHGVNLSLSIPHDVRNVACGRTPVCIECERLIDNGVVVVAAAGNLGYQSFETKNGAYEDYTALSVTDLGRERSFQGHGMLDVLRAFQKIRGAYRMIFSLDVRRARKGDCLLLHYGTPAAPGLMMIDGGPAQVYGPQLKPRIMQIRKARGLADDVSLPVDMLLVSHIDDDHINGILELTAEMVVAQDAHRSLPLKIRSVWHNSFDNILGNSPAELRSAVTAQFGAAALGGASHIDGLDPHAAHVLASIDQGFRLRDDAKKLKLRINPEFGGGLVMAKDGKSIAMGKGLKLRVAGPLQPELVALQAEHDAWLKKQAKQKASKRALAAFADTSVPNLSSIVVLAECAGKRVLLTGDARGDKILKGLGRAPAGPGRHRACRHTQGAAPWQRPQYRSGIFPSHHRRSLRVFRQWRARQSRTCNPAHADRHGGKPEIHRAFDLSGRRDRHGARSGLEQGTQGRNGAQEKRRQSASACRVVVRQTQHSRVTERATQVCTDAAHRRHQQSAYDRHAVTGQVLIKGNKII